MDEMPSRLGEADARLLAALTERLRLARDAARQGAGVRTDREVETLDAVLEATAPEARRFVLPLWRALQAEAAGVKGIALWGGKDPLLVADQARRRFGFGPALRAFGKPEGALATARQPGVVAVLALDAQTPWWARLLAEPKLRVFGVLPEAGAEETPSALAVGDVLVEPTGRDETFWVTDAAESAAKIEEALGLVGFAAREVAGAGGLKLFALAGYVQRDDERLNRAPGRLAGVIGAAPAPYPV
jgi:hypothetical protein